MTKIIKHVDMSIDKCIMCHTTNTYMCADESADGSIYKFNLCIRCEEDADSRMTRAERIQTLCRWTMEVPLR